MVNRAFEELVDLPREVIVGQDDYGLFARPEAVRHQEADRQVLSTGQPATFEYCVNFRGQPVWLQVLKSPVRGPQGQVVGLFCTARDISDSKRNESDGQLVRVALEQRVADRTMGQKSRQMRHRVLAVQKGFPHHGIGADRHLTQILGALGVFGRKAQHIGRPG